MPAVEDSSSGRSGSKAEEPETFKIVVKRGRTVAEEFDELTTAAGPHNAATVVNARSKLIHLAEASGGEVEVPSGL